MLNIRKGSKAGTPRTAVLRCCLADQASAAGAPFLFIPIILVSFDTTDQKTRLSVATARPFTRKAVPDNVSVADQDGVRE
jgi:hypothetical protein